MNTSPWSDFADTFLAAEEQRRHQEFLARESLNFIASHEASTVIRRATQAALPFLGDLCILALRDGQGKLADFHFAFLDSADEVVLKELVSSQRDELQDFLERILPLDAPVSVGSSELGTSSSLFRALNTHSGAAIRIGGESPTTGLMLFLENRSHRGYGEDRLHLIRDYCELVRQSLSRTWRTDFLKQEVASRERLISIAAHELGTPLTALHLQVELLRRHLKQTSTSEKTENALASMSATISSLSNSLGMLFNLSEVQRGQVILQKEPADMVAMLREVASRMDALVRRAGCTLELKLPEKADGYFDRRRIEQAITNLLANSTKYAPACQITITLFTDGNRVEIEIGDTGPGIPDSHHHRIFEAFRRGSQSQGVQGLGLGLFISRAVVQAHGGELHLASRPGEGARFLMKLPLWEV